MILIEMFWKWWQ